jgi:imidazolonepropionase-like amidohydrolase
MRKLLVGGHLFDGEAPPIPGHGVLIDGGLIVRIAAAGDFVGFAGQQIDTAGCTVMPGLIDCHVHLHLSADDDANSIWQTGTPADLTLRILENAQAALFGGVTTLRDQGGKDFHELAVRDAIDAGRHLGPTIKAAGKVIAMTGGHGHPIAWETDGVDEVVRATRLNVKAGVDHIKIMATGGVTTPLVDPLAPHLTVEEMTAAVRTAHSLDRPVAAHAEGANGIRNALAAGVDSIEHGFELEDDIIETMIAQGAYLVPTLSALRHIVEGGGDFPAHIVEKAARFVAVQRESFRRYVKAGGRIAMGTDAGSQHNFHGENAQELALMVADGLSQLEALRASTSHAADLLRLADAGRLREGHRADILVVVGNPATDIDAVADRGRHRLVLKGGHDVRSHLQGVVMARREPRFGPATLVSAG